MRTELRELGEERRQAKAEQERLTAELRRLARQARAEDVPVTEIADLANVSLEAVYKILRAE